MHRVTLPMSASRKGSDIMEQRYSIPYFVSPDHESIVSALSSCVSENRPLTYKPVKFCEYGEYLSKYMYQGSKAENGT